MAMEPNDVRKTTIRRLRQELVADVKLANNLLFKLNRYLDQLRIRALELLRVEADMSLCGAQIRRIFLDGYGVLVVRTVIFKISSFKLQNARLLLIFTKYSVITAILKYKRLSDNSLQ
ncbi:hypothetical protein Tco_0407440 [Tanacetum coccineum]